jgi:hypothetical protein
MGVTRITDHAAQAADAMPGMWNDSTALLELQAAIMAEVQQAEDLSADCIDLRMLSDAEGAQLDVPYGVLAMFDRLDSSDDEYRLLLRVAFRANNSDGCMEDVIWVASEAMGAPARYHQEGVACFRLQVFTDDGASEVHVGRVIDLLTRAAPVGVRWELVAGPVGAFQLEVTPLGSAPLAWRVGATA